MLKAQLKITTQISNYNIIYVKNNMIANLSHSPNTTFTYKCIGGRTRVFVCVREKSQIKKKKKLKHQ